MGPEYLISSKILTPKVSSTKFDLTLTDVLLGENQTLLLLISAQKI